MPPEAPAEAEERLSALERAIAPMLRDLLTPALVIDLGAVEHNISTFVRHVGTAKRWRPHVKTLKQSRLVRMLMSRKVGTFKCATLDELSLVLDTAERVHPDGEVDVLVAFPLGTNEVRGAVELSRENDGATIRLMADSPEHLRALSIALEAAGARAPWEVLLDVDLGMRRTGATVDTWRGVLDELVDIPRIRVVGLHAYDGDLAWTDRVLAHDGHDRLLALAKSMPRGTVKWMVTSGTHSFEHALCHPGLDKGKWTHQVSPGTLVLSDLRTTEPALALGLRQAAFVLTRVVSTPGDDRITVDAGSKALSPDRPAPACAVLGHPRLRGLEPSEEHRQFHTGGGPRPGLGDLLWLVPEHVCTTVNLHRQAHYVRDGDWVGTGQVEAMSRHSRLERRR